MMLDSETIETRHLTVVSIGSNTPERRSNVAAAIERLSTQIDIEFKAPVFESSPLSGKGSDYANSLVAGTTALTCEQLTLWLKQDEIACGRDLAARERGDVPLDLDIVYFDGTCLRPAETTRPYYQRALSLMENAR